jgi:tight adherence protein C
MANPTLLNLAILFIAIAVTGAVFVFVNSFTMSAPERDIRPGDSKSLLGRLRPLLIGVVGLLDRIPPVRAMVERLAGKLHMRLLRAGQPGGLTPKEFVVLKFLLGATLFAWLTLQFGLSHFPICLAVSFVAFYWPTLWLNEQGKRQNMQIIKELPDALDLLALMIGAGLDLGQAIAYYSRGARLTPLKRLLDEVRNQMALGRTRSNALEYLARKVDMPAVTQAVSAFVQGDRLGASISETLATQATDLREQRLQRAETHGQTASIKLLAPLLLFIMPCVGLVLFGPMIIQFTTGQ